ncbi:MAG: delta-60 repeat domain-containing protein, partial [Acidobacteriota bacterium]
MNISQTTFKRVFIFVQLILIAFVSISTVTAQSSSLDLSFNPIISKDRYNNGNLIQPNFTLQPDGKILTYGTFQIINGVIRTNIARLNPDGSLDTSFDCAACDFFVGSVVVQPDGKIIVAGLVYSSVTGTY